MLSLSLRISCKFFVPKMFLRVVWESNLNKELSSFPSYFMFCQSFGNCLTIILALWSGGRSLHLQRLRLHLRPCIIVFETLYNFSSSFETLYIFFRFFFFFFYTLFNVHQFNCVFNCNFELSSFKRWENKCHTAWLTRDNIWHLLWQLWHYYVDMIWEVAHL